MTTKKIYEKPSTKVYELKHRQQLLVGSGLGDPNDYPDGGDPLGF
jgi:hypothetical protein